MAAVFDAHDVADRGRKIYEKVRRTMEVDHRGRFAVIDVRTEQLFVGDSPEDAYRAARQASQDGPFHIVRIGERAVYRSTRGPRWRRRLAR